MKFRFCWLLAVTVHNGVSVIVTLYLVIYLYETRVAAILAEKETL